MYIIYIYIYIYIFISHVSFNFFFFYSATVAERDLSRQRKDFDMMKYPGFTLETNQSLPLTSKKGSVIRDGNGDNFGNQQFTYGESMSLVTLRPKLGDVDPNAMLERLFASEQIDVSRSAFHLARERRRAASAGLHNVSDSRCDERNRNGASSFTLMDLEDGHINQPEEALTGADKVVVDDSYGDVLCEKNLSETQHFLSPPSYVHNSSARTSSPILTTLWRREEQDSEFLTSNFSSAEPVKMDTSYDLLTPSSMVKNMEDAIGAYDGDNSSNNAEDRDGQSLRYNSTSLTENEEETILHRDLFPILTTTNIYSSDFASMLSDTLSSDLSSFQPLLDPPQSIPLTNATSFSDGHDFMFPNATLGGVKFVQEPYLTFGSFTESENYDRMDTPVCFDAQELDEGERNFGVFPSNSKQQGSHSSHLISTENAEFQKESCYGSVSAMFTPSGNSTWSDCGKKPIESALSQDVITDNDMPVEDSTVRQLSHPNNVTILNDTVFRGDKLFKVSSQSGTTLNGVSSTSTDVGINPSLRPDNRLSMTSKTTADTAFKTNGSSHKAGRPKQAVSLNITPSSVHENHNGLNSSDFLSKKHELGSASNPVMQENSCFLGDGSSKDFETTEKGGEIGLPRSNSKSNWLRSNSLSPHSVEKSSESKNGSASSYKSSDSVESKESFHSFSYTQLRSPDHNIVGALTSTQGRTASGLTSPSSSCFSTPQAQSFSDSSSSSSDGETSGRRSLLRTLLDKEGAAIQGPVTYAEWVLQKTLKDKNSTDTNEIFNKTISGKRAFSRKSRVRRGNFKRSTELPLPKYSHGSVVRYGKDALQHRKPTTELPLPSVSLSQSTNSTLLQSKCTSERQSSVQNNSSSSNISADDFLLPDDLLDLAVEYCGSMGPEQTDALLSDFTEMSSFEDNLFSLVGSPAQTKTNGSHPTKADRVKSLSVKRLLNFPPKTTNSSFGNDQQTFLSSSTVSETLDTDPSQVASSNEYYSSSLISENSKSLIDTNEKQSRQSSAIFSRSNEDSKTSSTTARSSNGNTHMSLLRAAVTTPDVDKLIEQIPFGNRGHYDLGSNNRLSHMDTLESDNLDSDIVITKISGFNNTSERKATSCFAQEKPSKASEKLGNKPYSQLPFNTNGKLDAIFFDHVYTASIVSPQVTKPINTSAMSPPLGYESIPNGSIRKQSTSAKVIVNPLSTTKTAFSNNTVSHTNVNGATNSPNNGKQRHVANSRPRQSGGTASSYPTRSSPFEAPSGSVNSGKSDLSSTEPVSVMIMRKESHRSRRSKSIAVQTDNAPGEVYPEFERSPSDVILYPKSSTLYGSHHASAGFRDQQTPILSNSTATSPSSSPSPSTPTHSPSNMSQLERFLRGYSKNGENMDTVTSLDENEFSPLSTSPRSGSTTPFLQRLLTGELSRDNYRRLDEQMRENERRQSGSSTSDLDIS